MEQENITIPVDEFKKVIELFKEATNQLKDNSERLKRIEEEIGLTEDAQKAQQERIQLAKLKLAEYKQKLTEESNAIYPLTPCGVIPYPIGAKTSNLLPLDANPDLPNQEDAFPLIFSLPLDGDVGKIVEESMMNDALYTASIAATWFTTGQRPRWSQTVIDKCDGYNKGAEIREYTPDDHDHVYVYWISSVDRNKSPRPTISSHVNWDWIFYIDINGFIYFNHSISAPKVTITNSTNKYTTECNGDIVIIRDQNLNFLMKLNDKHLEFYDAVTSNLLANYSFDNSKVPLSMANQFKDSGGVLGSSDNGNPEYTYLGGGNVIIQGVMQSTNGRFSVVLPRGIQANVGGNFPPVFGEPIVNQQIDPTVMQSIQVDVGMANSNTIVGSIAKFVSGNPVPLNVTVGYFLKAKLA
jgi:hypothetical protein